MFFVLNSGFVYTQYSFGPFIKTNDEQSAALVRLDSTQVKIHLTTVLADVAFEQVFHNISEVDSIQAELICPLSKNSSLYFLEVKVDNQAIELQSKSMYNTRKQIQAENNKGRKINVTSQGFNDHLKVKLPKIKPLSTIRITLKYTEILEPEEDKFRFTLPKVDGVRYPDPDKPIDNWMRQDYTLFPSVFESYFDVAVNLIGSIPLNLVKIDTHEVKIEKLNERHYQILLENNKYQGDREFVVNYDYTGKDVNAGLLSYSENGCDYILGTVQPPENIDEDKLAPREYIFMMDVSGSMNGFPLDISKKLISDILRKLKPGEKFNIMFFAGSSEFLSKESLPATEENIVEAINMVDRQKSKGFTKLSEAMRKVYAYNPDPEFNRIVIIISDGNLNEGGPLYLDLKSNRMTAQFFSFGIGYEVNRKTLEQLAFTSGTKPIIITEEKRAQEQMIKFENLILTPLMRNVQLTSKDVSFAETYPKNFNGFLSNEPVTYIIKDCNRVKGGTLNVVGINGKEKYEQTLRPVIDENSPFAEGIKFYWAKSKMDYLLREEERCGSPCEKSGRYKRQIEKIGEEFNIATPYNSFLETHSKVEDNGKITVQPMFSYGREIVMYVHNDYDTDNDGIPDDTDHCPLDAGPKETFGCPIYLLPEEEKPLAVANVVNEQFKGIEFDFDSYVIRKDSYKLLDEAIAIIKKYPEHQYVVEGHTDAAGPDWYNDNLSLNRAKSVRDYLVSKGINSSSLSVKGFGAGHLKWKECNPITVCPPWKNFENRRVLIVPVVK